MVRPILMSNVLAAALSLLACAGPQAAVPPPGSCPAAEAAPPTAPASSAGTAAIPYDLPKPGEFLPPPPEMPAAGQYSAVTSVLAIDIDKSGTMRFNGKALSSADEIVVLTRAELVKDPEIRAIIRADTGVSWGMVLGALDRLKQGGCSKIAFGVTPIPP